MEIKAEDRLQNINIIRQRNFFAGCTLLLVIANFLSAVKIAGTAERIIMVPGITKDLAVEGEVVSQSYLEETSLLFASALLDLTADTIDAKKNIILKHASTRSGQSLKSLQAYFAGKEEEHKKFGLSTFFSPKQIHVDSKNLRVVIEGLLTSTFGKRGFEQNNVKYLLSFDYVGGHLKLKEFSQIKTKAKEAGNKDRDEEGDRSTETGV